MPLRPRLIESLEPRLVLSSVLASVGAQPTGPLTGKIVYTNGGHGLTDTGAGVWATGRSLGFGIIEDLGNVDQMSLYAERLWQAGATVVPLRPVGHQTSEVIVDNVNATFTGTWGTSTNAPYFSTSNGNGAHYRFASGSTTETATARFTPNLPKTDFYPVYAWALNGTDRAIDQIYRVNHTGGATEVKVDGSRVGKGWIYLGTYRFTAGTSGSVEVSNKTPGLAKVVIADAIRFGNGMGDIAHNGKISGEAREDEASLYWVEASAGWTESGTRVSSTNYRSSVPNSDMDANVSAPLRWSAYMNAAPFGQSVYLSFHSNAGGGRGVEGLYNVETDKDTANQFAWADLVGREVNNDLVAYGSPPLPAVFVNDQSPTYFSPEFAFGEIRGDTSGNEFDATILEVAFHDDATDASILRDPNARDKVAQSAVQATVRYFNQFGGGAAVAFTPDAPTNVRTSVDRNGNVTIRWDAPATSAIFGGAPTGYRVFASRDGYGFDGGQDVVGATSLTLSPAIVGSGPIFFRVVATNAGGWSPASPVVAVRNGDVRAGRILIVNGFDRYSADLNPIQSIAADGTNIDGPNAGIDLVNRIRPRNSNSFDYAVQHALAIANHPADIGFDTIDNAALISGAVSLAGYRAVVWMLGEESTANRTFDATEQSLVTSYLNAGGKLFVSGAEIGWDLQAKGNGTAFFNNVLHTKYVSDDAGTYAAGGVADSIFSGVTLGFDNGTKTYDVDYPDRLTPNTGATGVLNYTGGLAGTAAVAWSGANGTQTLVMGFPFETITTDAARAAIMRKSLDYFGFGTLAPIASVNPSLVPIATGGFATPINTGGTSAESATSIVRVTRGRSTIVEDIVR